MPVDAIPDGWLGLDVGPSTVEQFGGIIGASQTVVWNGAHRPIELA